MELSAVLTSVPEGGYVALNPETGTTTQGETVEEALTNLREATELYLEEFPLHTSDKFGLMQLTLAQLAKEDGIPLQETTANQQDPLFDIIGIAEAEETDVARQHDDYLYGALAR